MKSAEFRVDVTAQSALDFAALSGDWNPLHTDSGYAAETAYRRPVLHGAFSAGLFSRMAGMHLPGTECLLHSLQLRFVTPIVPPASLVVSGRVVSDTGEIGRVEVSVSDANTGVRYVDGSYGFGRHVASPPSSDESRSDESPSIAARTHDEHAGEPVVLVTGASGAVGRALIARLGMRALGVARSAPGQWAQIVDVEQLPSQIDAMLSGRKLAAIVHCAWPAPDNVQLTALPVIESGVEHFVAAPLRQSIVLAQVLKQHGLPDAALVLLGSTAAAPGRHNYRMPLYSLGKALIPELVRVLATELGATRHRAMAVVLDVVDGGMNESMSKMARIAHAGRAPSGTLPTADDVAAQLIWVLDNQSSLLSGAVLTLTGGALP
jgi:3-hydroxybutyryl-CoA dehydratase